MIKTVNAQDACQYAGLTQREIAEEMGLRTEAAVSRQLKRLEQMRNKNRKVFEQIKRLDAAVEDGLNY